MKIRRNKLRTIAAMRSCVVVELRVPEGWTPFSVLRAVQSALRNRVRGRV